jgi:hypothetical protein
MPRGQDCLELADLPKGFLTLKISESGIGKAPIGPALKGSLADDDGQFSEVDFEVMLAST